MSVSPQLQEEAGVEFPISPLSSPSVEKDDDAARTRRTARGREEGSRIRFVRGSDRTSRMLNIYVYAKVKDTSIYNRKFLKIRKRTECIFFIYFFFLIKTIYLLLCAAAGDGPTATKTGGAEGAATRRPMLTGSSTRTSN